MSSHTLKNMRPLDPIKWRAVRGYSGRSPARRPARRWLTKEVVPRNPVLTPAASLLALALVFLTGAAPPAAADVSTVTYSVTNISGSEWAYAYTLGGSVSGGDLLAIYFPAAASSNIANLTTSVSGFATSVLQPDTTIPAAGEYDIFANSSTSNFPSLFEATFNYSDAGIPGAQSFTLYDSSFAAIETGTAVSTTATPEPNSWILLLIGFALLFTRVIFKKKWKTGARSAAVLAFAALIVALPGTTQAQGPPGGGGGTPPGGGGGTPPGGGGGTPPGGGGGTTTTVSGMTIGPYQLLSSYRSSVYQYYYTFTTSVTNTNSAPYTYVLGTLTSSNANTVVVSGSVEFGLVPGGGTATGLTPFTILQDRRYALDPTSLTWTFTGTTSSSTVGTTVSSVALATSSTSTTYGTGVDLTAMVSPATGTGTITFYDGSAPLGTATLTSGSALLSSVVLPTGSHTIAAVYSGDTTYASSSSSTASVTITGGGAATSCSGLQETAQVVCLATAFEATLTSSQIATLQIAYSLANAERWSNLPGVTRNGLAFSSLTSTQLAAAQQLAQAAMSSQGYQRFQNIRGADNVLNSYSGSPYGSGNYYVAFLGSPSTTSPWQLQFGGHHFAFNHTFNGTYTSGTPYFFGTEPTIYSVAGTLYLPLQAPRDAAYGLTRSVYGNSSALLTGSFDDVVMGVNGSTGIDSNYPQTYPTTGRGLLYTSLTSAQQAQVKTLIEAWVNDMDTATASSLLSVYEDATALASTYVGYAGTGTLASQGDYIRVDGPRVWIEFVVQNGVVFSSSYHFHTLWRDKTADYGGDFLSQ